MRAKPPPKFNRKDTDTIVLDGGYDTETPPMHCPPGRLRSAQNWELGIKKGYRRIVGYERFDGQARPSDAAFFFLDFSITIPFVASPVFGDVMAGVTSGASCTVIVGTAQLGEFSTSSPIVTKLSGNFIAGEALTRNGAGYPALVTAEQRIAAFAATKSHAHFRNLAADVYRADIDAVPGSGSVRGVKQLNDVVYAFRDNAGATACDLYKSSAAGWTQVALGRELAFNSGGVTEITEGQTITGATSGATAVLTRVMLESGTWAAGTAAGKFIFASQTGTFQAENIDVGASLNLATIAGNSSAITLLPGGRYTLINKNFGGSANTKRMYGADGQNRGFEFDGSVFCPIKTGMNPDRPLHVDEHELHLFFSFGGSAQHSGPGTPYQWTLLSGAAELAMGDTITGFSSQPGSEVSGALAIFCRNKIGVLYGKSALDWNLVTFQKEAGAYAYSIQPIGVTMMLDDRGLTTLASSARFGNFVHATASDHVQRWLNGQRTKVISSCVARDKSQYRVFFSDNSAAYVTVVGGQIKGILPILFNDKVECIDSDENTDGEEEIYFGSSDGFVYQLERGTSFDGDNIAHHMHLAFNFTRSARWVKDYFAAIFEVQGDGYAQFNATSLLDYASTDVAQPSQETVTTNFQVSLWDSFVWDAFVWDGVTLSPNRIALEGQGENISIMVSGSSDYHDAITISSLLFDYSILRRKI